MKNLEHANLLDIVFSWTLEDVLNENLFEHQSFCMWQATETKMMMESGKNEVIEAQMTMVCDNIPWT
ncbi:hypothetical protein E2542_SST21088 [Spatholobus suberectus]|nr:hypothetical protein E2542_SST21088 [Spatholobus suberectus]